MDMVVIIVIVVTVRKKMRFMGRSSRLVDKGRSFRWWWWWCRCRCCAMFGQRGGRSSAIGSAASTARGGRPHIQGGHATLTDFVGRQGCCCCRCRCRCRCRCCGPSSFRGSSVSPAIRRSSSQGASSRIRGFGRHDSNNNNNNNKYNNNNTNTNDSSSNDCCDSKREIGSFGDSDG